MAEHSNFGGALRPDQQRYAHLMGGGLSPLWVPFMAAASMGAAWWVMQNWPRMVGGANSSSAGGVSGDGASASGRAEAPAQPAQALAGQARSFSQEVAAPVTESLAVQGANDSEAAAQNQTHAPTPAPAPKQAKAGPAKPPQAKQPAQAKPAQAKRAAPASQAASPAPRRAKASASEVKASGQDPAVSKLLAAANAHPEPELPPHEGLPARKKGGGKGKKNGG